MICIGAGEATDQVCQDTNKPSAISVINYFAVLFFYLDRKFIMQTKTKYGFGLILACLALSAQAGPVEPYPGSRVYLDGVEIRDSVARPRKAAPQGMIIGVITFTGTITK
jgi:hypothetical protein